MPVKSPHNVKFSGAPDRLQKGHRSLFCSCTVAVVCCLIPHRAFPQRFVEVSSQIDLVSFKKETNGVPFEQHWSFSPVCVVGTNQWRIDGNFVKNATVSYYFDGTNVYQSIRLITNSSAPLRITGPAAGVFPAERFSPEQVASNLTINIAPSPGGAPLGTLRVNVAWLVFCSGAYLRLPGRAIPLPTVFVPGTPGAFGYEDKTELFMDELALPKRIELFTSRERYARSIMDERLLRYSSVEVARVEARSPYPDGMRVFSYQVEQSTNFSGWNFPTKFSYVGYRASRGEWEKFVAGMGRLTSLRESLPPTNVFIEGMTASIMDRRFRHNSKKVDALWYHSTNASPASVNNPILKHKFQARVNSAPPDLLQRVRRTRWMLTVLVLAGILPVAILVFRRARVSRGQNAKRTAKQ